MENKDFYKGLALGTAINWTGVFLYLVINCIYG